MDEDRFSRLEQKIYKLDELKLKFTTVEEKQNRFTRSLERAFSMIEDLEEKNRKMESTNATNSAKIYMNERVIWMFISSIFGIAGYFINHI